jgi:hypothetical protein
MIEIRKIENNPLPWLLEDDPQNPGVRYITLTKLLDLSPQDPQAIFARKEIMNTGPVPAILNAQSPEGYWVKPGPGYGPKYKSTVWAIIMLAQLGADASDDRVRRGCNYVLEHTRADYGGFSAGGDRSGLIHCLQGNLVAALIDLGWLDDERLQEALDWLARSIIGEGIASAKDKSAPVRYYRSGNSAPGFICSANNHLPCAWGAVKAILALSKVPTSKRTTSIKSAIQVGLDFLLGNDPAIADYPMGYSSKPNQSWFRFGYPLFYVTDVLQNLEVLTRHGYGTDPRINSAIELLLSKQDSQGRWKMEYTYNGKTWVDIEEKGQPSKWVTFRALGVLKST